MHWSFKAGVNEGHTPNRWAKHLAFAFQLPCTAGFLSHPRRPSPTAPNAGAIRRAATDFVLTWSR